MGEVDNGIEIFSNFNIQGISDLCKHDDHNYLLPPSSCIEHPSPPQSDSSVSSWIQGIEHMLFNDLDLLPQHHNQNEDDFLPDDFFADLDLPVVPLQSQSESGTQIVKDSSFQEENTAPISFDVQNNHNNNSSQDEDFFDFDLLLDVSVDQFDDVPLFNDNQYSTPESLVASSEDPAEKDNNFPSSSSEGKGEDQKEENSPPADVAASEDKDDDDPITKKRKRQMRNRDAAVRSRERKKVYVKDLEVKSQYLERECIRLQRLLQCCSAENHALHLQLQQEKAFMATRTKQESAVLLLESLLLGSLLWFLAILGLSLPLEPQLPAGVLAKMGSNCQEVVELVVPGRAKSKSIGLGTFFMNRRCKASRSKMKIVACYNAVVA